MRRVGPVVTELVRAGLTVSIDTMRARVAEFALEAGAQEYIMKPFDADILIGKFAEAGIA